MGGSLAAVGGDGAGFDAMIRYVEGFLLFPKCASPVLNIWLSWQKRRYLWYHNIDRNHKPWSRLHG